MVAVQGGREDVVALLLTFGVHFKLLKNFQITKAIHLARKWKRLKLIILLSMISGMSKWGRNSFLF